jgi:hypothetical protein
MLIFVDPGAGYYSTTTQGTQGLWTGLSGSIVTSGLPAGNIEPTALNITNAGGVITVPNSPGVYTLGFRLAVLQAVTSNQSLLAWKDPSGNTQAALSINSGGTMQAWRGTFLSTSLGNTSGSVAISANVWIYLEFQLYISATVGIFSVQANGTNVLNLTSQNTKGSGSSSNIGSIVIGSNYNCLYQDIYVTNNSGSYNTSFLGDIELPISLANANGTYTAWTANGTTPLYNCVNAALPADGPDFASDSAPGDRMAVKYPNTSVTGNIVAVQHVSRMLKSTSGTRTVSQVITNNGVDNVASADSLGTTYQYYQQTAETDPNTNLPWTAAGVNTVQTGLITES